MTVSSYKPEYTKDMNLVSRTINKAFDQLYPELDFSAYPSSQIINVIIQLAKSLLAQQHREMINVCKMNEGTFFENVKDLNLVAPHVKAIAFKNKDKSVTFYIHLRKRIPQNIIVAGYKECRDTVRLDVKNDKVSTAKIGKVLVSRVAVGAEEYQREKAYYANEVTFLKKYSKRHCMVGLYHTFKEKVIKNGVDILKMRIYEERFPSDMRSHIRKVHAEDAPELTDADKKRVFLHSLKSLMEMHKKKIAHADIKPGNLLVDDENELKVVFCDLAFSKELSDQYEQTSMAGGTLTHVAYEDYLNAIAKSSRFSSIRSLASDVWAMGRTLYAYLNGDQKMFTDLFHCSILLNEEIQALTDINNRLYELERVSSLEQTSPFIEKKQRYALVETAADWPEVLPAPITRTTNSGATVGQGNVDLALAANPTKQRASPNTTMHEQLNLIEERIDTLLGFLASLKPAKCVSQQEPKQKEFINSILDYCEALMINIKENLLGENLIKKDQTVIEIKTYVKAARVCDKIIRFNSKLIEKIDLCVKTWVPNDEDDFFMRLVKGMMHPEAFRRLTAKEAYKEVKKFRPA